MIIASTVNKCRRLTTLASSRYLLLLHVLTRLRRVNWMSTVEQESHFFVILYVDNDRYIYKYAMEGTNFLRN